MAAPTRTTVSTRSLPDFMAADSLAEVVAALLELGVNTYEAQANEAPRARPDRRALRSGRCGVTVIPLSGPRHAARGQSRRAELVAVAATLLLGIVRRPAKRVLRGVATISMTTGVLVVGLAVLAGRLDVAVGVGAGIAVFLLAAAVLAPQEV
jgi:hypothetical protein